MKRHPKHQSQGFMAFTKVDMDSTSNFSMHFKHSNKITIRHSQNDKDKKHTNTFGIFISFAWLCDKGKMQMNSAFKYCTFHSHKVSHAFMIQQLRNLSNILLNTVSTI